MILAQFLFSDFFMNSYILQVLRKNVHFWTNFKPFQADVKTAQKKSGQHENVWNVITVTQ